MRGYFAIGIERASKAGNVGNLIRTAHGFGAAFVFTIGAHYGRKSQSSDTAKSDAALPFYEYATLHDLALPRHCRLVAVELVEDAVDLPAFHHPLQAAYILGGERLSVSEATLARCDHVVKIPTRFSLNVATAGAIVMYDRLRMLGRWPDRAISSLAPPGKAPPHAYGGPRQRRQAKD